MKTVLSAALVVTVVGAAVCAQFNAGQMKSDPNLPFTMTQVATFQLPWRIAFLPDGRMLVTEKVGPVWLVTQQGQKTPVDNVPAVVYQGQGGMLGVFVSPKYATDRSVYLTYSEPADPPAARVSGLALACLHRPGRGSAQAPGLQAYFCQRAKRLRSHQARHSAFRSNSHCS